MSLYLPPVLFIHPITSLNFQKSPVSHVFLCVSVLSGGCTRKVPLLPTWPVPTFGGAEGWEVGALLLFPGQSELLGWQSWDGARVKNRVSTASAATAELRAWRCRISRSVSLMLVKRGVGRNRVPCGAVSEGKKWNTTALSRTPGWLGMELLVLLQLLNYGYLPARDVCIFGAGGSAQAVTEALPMQETEPGEDILRGWEKWASRVPGAQKLSEWTEMF